MNGTLSDVFGLTFDREMSVIIDGKADRVRGQAVSSNFHSALGVPIAAGRPIVADDDRASAEPVAVISHHFWEKQFAMDPAAVGKKITINTVPVTIVGITPREFKGSVRV